jgi:oxygen-independent coproporphyrinogen III oxidase
MNQPGLYIHIPFCGSKCGYCDFYSVTSTEWTNPFLKALSMELQLRRDERSWGEFDTVYLGGGTPSVLKTEDVEHILHEVRRCFRIAVNAEITAEANPADLSPELLKAWRRAGVNRLNIGVQSLDRKTLDFLGRRHSVEQAISSMDAARTAGFEQMGLDLIYALPGQGLGAWFETLDRVLRHQPEHLSCYELTIEPATPIGVRARKGEFQVPDEKLLYDFFIKTSEFLEQAGYVHYEVSNFAKGMAFASRHNQKYWDHTPYLGLGPAAHSFQEGRRWWNVRSVEKYVELLNRGVFPTDGEESLSVEQLRLEALYLGLRTRRGLHLKTFAEKYGCDLLHEKTETVARLRADGLILTENGYLSPTRRGLALADFLALI